MVKTRGAFSCVGGVRVAVMLAVGVVVLAASRSYERRAAYSPAIAVLTAAFFKYQTSRSPMRVTAAVPPVILVLLTGGLSMGKDYDSLTGTSLWLPGRHWDAAGVVRC